MSQELLDKDDMQLNKLGLKDGSKVTLKDLGPQIGWQTVFFIEYLGPLLIHQLYRVLYAHQKLSFTQALGYVCVSFHFLKREYETLFVHRFSHATMPVRNLFKNSAHYWLLSGWWIAHTLYSPKYVEPPFRRVWVSALIFFLAELGNLYCHVILRRLRSKDPKARGIPRGFAFEVVSCPNYLFETVAWTAFSVMTGLTSAWVFTALATAQMYLWALKKHRAYKKEFPAYPKHRTSMFPFLP